MDIANYNDTQLMELACITTYNSLLQKGYDQAVVDASIENSIALQICEPGKLLSSFSHTLNSNQIMASMSIDSMILAVSECALKLQDMKRKQVGGNLNYLSGRISTQADSLEVYVNSKNFEGLRNAMIKGCSMIVGKEVNQSSINEDDVDYNFTKDLLTLYRNFVVEKRIISSGTIYGKETVITDPHLQVLDVQLNTAFGENNINKRSY